MIKLERTTKETNIRIALEIALEIKERHSITIDTSLPFFDHMLHSMAFHGRFTLNLHARGDVEVDPHHLVEDTGLTLGSALEKSQKESNGITRFAHQIVPMDDALSECVIDAGGRPYLHWDVHWQQEKAGNFDLFLLKDFFQGLAQAAMINLHICVRYSGNGHHAAEAIFKAAGRAIAQAYKTVGGGEAKMSTKGTIEN